MQPTQKRPRYYWNTNDAAGLSFNESGSVAPTSIRCFNMQDHLNRGEFRDVPVEALTYLASGVFGEARPAGEAAKWTGDSHRYGIYRNPSGLYKNGIVVLESHGAGMVGYAFDNLVAGETWQHIAVTFSPEMIWNLCYQIAHAYRAARDAERGILQRAFIEGRMKKRRRSNRVYVEVVPAPASQAA